MFSRFVMAMLPAISALALLPLQAAITLDGDLSDWAVSERLYPAPWEVAGDYEVYGNYDNASGNYYFALKTTSATQTSIGPNTTVWLNTDRNNTTGYLIWGWAGGAEYNVNVYSDGSLHLYKDGAAQTWTYGPLSHAYDTGKTIVEFMVPGSALGGISDDIDLLLDINDAAFLPTSYANPQYTVSTAVMPPRTNANKRVAVVFSQTAADNFYDLKAYSQLYMAMQHQVMMAGIPYDLIHIESLTDVANIVNYDALIFPYAAQVKNSDLGAISETLYAAVYHYGIGIITAGDFMTNDENGNALPGNSYALMNNLMGMHRILGTGPVDIVVNADDVSHPVMKGYTADEEMFTYTDTWYSTYGGVTGNPTVISVLADQQIDSSGVITSGNAIIASETGGRNVHFSTIQLMGDGNLVWQALQWVVYGNNTPVALKMGRQKSIFLGRNDMDQSMFFDELQDTEIPLYNNFLVPWKNNYNFVGTYFINIGDDPNHGEYTDWTVSGPLYQNYISIGNEIGSHSYTHPHFINNLTTTEREYEFNQAQNVIKQEMGLSILGTAGPGNPESLAVATELAQWLPYFSGGYSGIGAGYPGAYGYLTPDIDMVYFAPNMYFDFTMIEFLNWTAVEAEQYWADQYANIMSHASQPLVHWPWHDYGPTTSLPDGYSIAMFENTIALAYNDDTEFTTTLDMHYRVKSFLNSDIQVTETGNTITAVVTASDAGKFSLEIQSDDVIETVTSWYAYDEETVFLPAAGGTFDINLNSSANANVTRISALPMRAELVSLTGDGTELTYTFKGEGTVTVQLNAAQAANLTASGADSTSLSGNVLTMTFDNDGTHTGVIE